MDEISKKRIIIAAMIVVGLCACGLLISKNQLTPSQVFTCEGTFTEQRSYFIFSDVGNKGGINLYFKLDSGEIVQFVKTAFTKAIVPGDRVSISYRKGAFFKNRIYDNYEPLKTPSRFWTGSELTTEQ